jgi:hypothetical protein
MDSTFYIDNATYPFCWELPLSILWLFSMIHTLVKTMVNYLQFGFQQGWYILVFRVPAQCENCLRIMVHSNNHPTLMGTYYLWIGWMFPIWHMCHIMHQLRYVSSWVLQRLPTISGWAWSSTICTSLFISIQVQPIQLSLHTFPSFKI